MSLFYQHSPSHDDAHASAQVKLLVVFDAHKVDDVCNDSVILRCLKAGSKARVVAVTDQVEQCVNGFNKVRPATLQRRHPAAPPPCSAATLQRRQFRHASDVTCHRLRG